MAVGNPDRQPLSARTAAVPAGHVGRSPSLTDAYRLQKRAPLEVLRFPKPVPSVEAIAHRHRRSKIEGECHALGTEQVGNTSMAVDKKIRRRGKRATPDVANGGPQAQLSGFGGRRTRSYLPLSRCCKFRATACASLD
jgi:hypothetical protein